MTDSLAPVDLPAPDADWRSYLTSTVTAHLDSAAVALTSITNGTAADVLSVWNDAEIHATQARILPELVAEVHPDADVRHEANELYRQAVAFAARRDADPDLYAAVEARMETPPGDARAARVREMVLRGFALEGAHLDAAARARLAELTEEISAATNEFSEHIRESVGRIRIEPERLAGLPTDYVEAHPADDEGLVTITTEYPDLMPFLDMAQDARAREELLRADYARAYPENDQVLSRLLRLRDEKARLLGYDGWPDYATATMMIDDGAAIGEFLDSIETAARPAGEADAATLLERMREDHPDADAVGVADSRYYLEVLRTERFGLDARELRRYFTYERVRDGILELASDLFQIGFTRVEDAGSWHADVEVYDVLDGDRRIGRIHLDMHPRSDKYGHMACFGVISGIADRHLPEAALVCNFPRGSMTFEDVETFLHEFGHLLHAIFSGSVEYARLEGLSEQSEWDFVEAPSQLLEEWAWTHEVLSRFAVTDEGEVIPRELVDALRATRDFGEGLLTCRQLVYANLSYRLHREIPEDLAVFAAGIEERYDVRQPLAGTHQFASFGHLTTYSACYYTYQWSLAIAKDLFTAFDPDHLMDAETGRRYREAVLAPGGSKPAAELVEDFLGRPFSTQAYEEWLASLSSPRGAA